MTCTTKTRTSVPARLLAYREAEEAERAAWDAHVWACNDTTRAAAEREAVASIRFLRWVAANEALLAADADYREAAYLDYRPEGAGHDAARMPF